MNLGYLGVTIKPFDFLTLYCAHTAVDLHSGISLMHRPSEAMSFAIAASLL